MADVVGSVRRQLDADEAKKNELAALRDGAGCPGLWGDDPVFVPGAAGVAARGGVCADFAGFELVKADPRFVDSI